MNIEYPASADSFLLKHPIGKGATAVVWYAICNPLNSEVAIKIIDLENIPSNMDEIRKEIQLMRLCNHPNVVSFRSSFIHKTNLWMVMDYSSGGSIYEIMRYSFPSGMTNEILIATILRDALQGIAYLHSTERIHRDVKAGNLLLHEDGVIKVGDFGVSAWLIEDGMKRSSCKTFVGTPCWMAPEVMEQSQGYDYKADIWSLGITALELTKGKAPLAHYPAMKVLLMTLQNPPPTLENPDGVFSRHFENFVEVCLQKDPDMRPTAAKLLNHKFFLQAESSDYVRENLLKNLPPFWERVAPEVREITRPDGATTSNVSLESSLDTSSWNFSEEAPQSIPQSENPIVITPSESTNSTTIVSSNNNTIGSTGSVRGKRASVEPSRAKNMIETNPTPVPNEYESQTMKITNRDIPNVSQIVTTNSESSVGKKEVKGRFTKTVIQRVNPDEKKVEEEKSEKQRTDPLSLMSDLNKIVVGLMKENESLKAQNSQLKTELAALKKANNQ